MAKSTSAGVQWTTKNIYFIHKDQVSRKPYTIRWWEQYPKFARTHRGAARTQHRASRPRHRCGVQVRLSGAL